MKLTKTPGCSSEGKTLNLKKKGKNMKRHYSLILLALLSQTTPMWAMEEDDIPEHGTQCRPASTTGQTLRTSSPEDLLIENLNRVSSITEAEHEGLFNFNVQTSQGLSEESRYANPLVSCPPIIGPDSAS
jgi:hypothetical protein